MNHQHTYLATLHIHIKFPRHMLALPVTLQPLRVHQPLQRTLHHFSFEDLCFVTFICYPILYVVHTTLGPHGNKVECSEYVVLPMFRFNVWRPYVEPNGVPNNIEHVYQRVCTICRHFLSQSSQCMH